jgi:hypothetical protein
MVGMPKIYMPTASRALFEPYPTTIHIAEVLNIGQLEVDEDGN